MNSQNDQMAPGSDIMSTSKGAKRELVESTTKRTSKRTRCQISKYENVNKTNAKNRNGKKGNLFIYLFTY